MLFGLWANIEFVKYMDFNFLFLWLLYILITNKLLIYVKIMNLNI